MLLRQRQNSVLYTLVNVYDHREERRSGEVLDIHTYSTKTMVLLSLRLKNVRGTFAERF